MVLHPAIQPTLCVIGYPVAGNSMQFAIERALVEAGLDWKFVSFNVHPDAFDEAVRGVQALGIAGVAIAAPYETQLANHVDRFRPGCDADHWIDFLQPSEQGWQGSNQRARAVYDLVCQSISAPTQALILGDGRQANGIAMHFAAQGIACVDSIAKENIDASVAVVRGDAIDGAACPIDADQVDAYCNAGCCVELTLDTVAGLSIGPQTVAVSAVDVLVQQFFNSFADWTGTPPHQATLREAIEEYFEL